MFLLWFSLFLQHNNFYICSKIEEYYLLLFHFFKILLCNFSMKNKWLFLPTFEDLIFDEIKDISKLLFFSAPTPLGDLLFGFFLFLFLAVLKRKNILGDFYLFFSEFLLLLLLLFIFLFLSIIFSLRSFNTSLFFIIQLLFSYSSFLIIIFFLFFSSKEFALLFTKLFSFEL